MSKLQRLRKVCKHNARTQSLIHRLAGVLSHSLTATTPIFDTLRSDGIVVTTFTGLAETDSMSSMLLQTKNWPNSRCSARAQTGSLLLPALHLPHQSTFLKGSWCRAPRRHRTCHSTPESIQSWLSAAAKMIPQGWHGAPIAAGWRCPPKLAACVSWPGDSSLDAILLLSPLAETQALNTAHTFAGTVK